MCLLTFFPDGVKPDAEALTNGAVFNDDGHGYAIVTNREMIVSRSLSAEDLIAEFVVQRHRHPDGPALFHSRMSTHGNNSTENCHPFAVDGDSRTVIAHNGILPENVHPTKHDPRSDTRIAADDFIPSLGSLRHRRIRKHLERWMTTANKMVILSIDRKFRENAYILNEKQGTWDGGIWYSNDGYLPSKWKSYGKYSSYAWYDQREDKVVDESTHCLDCLDRWADCQCWFGAGAYETELKKWADMS